MKRIGILFGLAAIGLLASCGSEANTTTEKKDETTTVSTTTETTTVVPTTTVDETPVSIICPSGTPALGLANYYDSVKGASFEIVNGADQLVAAFGTKSHDVIVAPVNLGAKFYNTNENYVLAKTFVWGNLFLASKAELTSFEDINNKKLVVFGKNSTPDILTQILIKEKDLKNVTIEYVDDVASANSVLVAGTAEYTITAEPAISKIKDANGINVIDLQDEYKKVTGKDSYPQAGIFIKKEAKEDSKVLNAVDALVNSVKDAVENPANTAKKAVAMHKSFETVGEAALTKAIPNCHFIIMDHDKEVAAVNEYLQYMIDLGFGKQAGDKLPNEEFFL